MSVLEKETIEKLFEALHEIANASGSWQSKRRMIIDAADIDQITNLTEFCVWFGEIEEEC